MDYIRNTLLQWKFQIENWKSLSRVRLFATLWTVSRQSPLSMEFSRQEYRSNSLYIWTSLLAQPVKNPPAIQFWFLGWKDPWRRDGLPTPVFLGFPGGSDGKESTCNAGDLGLIPGLGRSPGGEHGNPFQYSCLENPMHRGAWWATVHGFRKSWTWLSD